MVVTVAQIDERALLYLLVVIPQDLIDYVTMWPQAAT
jgi:hypothetical protein